MSVFICLIICFSFGGCNNAEKKNKEAKEILNKVLNKEQDFIFKSLVFDKVTEENLEKFSFSTVSNAINAFIPQSYAFVDFNSDGIEELLMVEVTLKFFLILRYDSEKVYGYIIENISLQDIKTDGSFLTLGNVYNEDYKVVGTRNTISRVEFDGTECKISNLAYKDDSSNIYKLNEKSAEKEETEKYFDDWNNNTIKIDWITIE